MDVVTRLPGLFAYVQPTSNHVNSDGPEKFFSSMEVSKVVEKISSYQESKLVHRKGFAKVVNLFHRPCCPIGAFGGIDKAYTGP